MEYEVDRCCVRKHLGKLGTVNRLELVNIGQMFVGDESASAMYITRDREEPESVIHFIIAVRQIARIAQYFILFSADHHHCLPKIGSTCNINLPLCRSPSF